jgi:glycosyltransferase involved in cell wall biosynthesis
MNIAIYVPSWPPGSMPNGIVSYAATLVPALRHLGHRVFVLTHELKSASDPDAVDVSQYRPASSLRAWISHKLSPEASAHKAIANQITNGLQNLIRQVGLDAFEVEESFGWAGPIARSRLVPVVVRLHGPWFLRSRYYDGPYGTLSSQLRQAWEEEAFRTADVVSAPCQFVLNEVSAQIGNRVRHGRVVPNPIALSSPEDRWSLSACQKNSILFVGRFDTIKGGDLVLEAFDRLAPRYPDLKITFVGPDLGVHAPEGKLKFQEFLSSRVRPEARSSVKFLGPQAPEAIARLRKLHFVCLVASRQEILPYTVLEAMAAGAPVVTSDVGGIPEMITDDHNGRMFPTENVEEMTRAIADLLDDPGRAARMGRQALLDCGKFYDPTVIANASIELYRQAKRALGS